MKLYFAGPLFNSAERNFNTSLTNAIESLGIDVYLPQRDGIESGKPPYNAMTKDQRREVLFKMDRDKILESEIFLFVLDGRIPDEGACVELGIAYTQRYLQNIEKLLVGLHTDSRAAFLGGKLNPMIKIPLDFIVSNEEELIELLEQQIISADRRLR